MNKHLLSVLAKIASKQVLAYQMRKSGNLKTKLSKMPIEDVLSIADAYYQKSGDKKPTIFHKGTDLRRVAKNKTVYFTELRDYVVYFIGTEADIVQRLDETPTVTQSPEAKDLQLKIDEELARIEDLLRS